MKWENTFKNSQYDDGSCQYDDEDDCGVGSGKREEFSLAMKMMRVYSRGG